jgi:hypothetical protein
MDGPEIPEAMFDAVRQVGLGLPETTLRSDRWAHSFQIRRNVFAHLLAPEDKAGQPVPILVVRADPMERAALLASGHPFFDARSGDRLGIVLADQTDWTEIAELVTESYRRVAPKKLVARLDEEA